MDSKLAEQSELISKLALRASKLASRPADELASEPARQLASVNQPISQLVS